MDTKLDLTFAQVVVDQIDDYVQAEVLFYPVGAINGMEMPPLTLGAWLETEWRLNATATAGSANVLNAARAEVQKARANSPDLYTNKAQREFRSRMDTWELWLADQKNNIDSDQPLNAGAVYASQVHVRLKLELLQDHVPQQTAQLLRLRMADETLQRRFRRGAFVWEPELAAAAPKDRWWWLWAS